jgi:cyclic pyranopterin phosphate synthase
LYTCLFAAEGHDLRSLLRDSADDALIRRELAQIWARRTDRYSEVRSRETIPLHKVEMSFIGG